MYFVGFGGRVSACSASWDTTSDGPGTEVERICEVEPEWELDCLDSDDDELDELEEDDELGEDGDIRNRSDLDCVGFDLDCSRPDLELDCFF